MRQRAIATRPLYPEDRPCRYPTMFDIVRGFRGIVCYEVPHGGQVTLFPAKLSPLQLQLLPLLVASAAL